MQDEIELCRRKLYAQVWEKPISRLAAELGISDAGLRNACTRHDIPVPARGHWARRAAGQNIAATPLPNPAEDAVVRLPRAVARSRVLAHKMTSAPASETITVPAAPDECHPLVRKTASFFAKVRAELERQEKGRLPLAGGSRWNVDLQSSSPQFRVGRLVNGRISSLGEGRLHIVATLGQIDWILRFHDALVSSLKAHDLDIVPKDGPSGRVEVIGNGSSLTMSFMEEFRKRQNPGSTLAVYAAKDSYKLQFHLRRSEAPRTWQGTQGDLEAALPTVGATVSRWLAKEAESDKLRNTEPEKSDIAGPMRKVETDASFADQELMRMRKLDQRAQVTRLLQAGNAYEVRARSLRLLTELTDRAPDDEAVHAWVQVVREQLADPCVDLLQIIRAEAAGEDRPLWWPRPPAVR